MLTELLKARGFEPTDTGDGMLHIKCSQCEALVINGTATHETGCPRQMHECRGCNELIPRRQRWCEECAS